MGKVYTPEQVSAGQIPSLGAHEKVADAILNGLRDNSEISPYTNALVYGSTATGRADVRSDLDLIVTHDEMPDWERDMLDTISEIINTAQAEFNVASEYKVVPADKIGSADYESGGSTERSFDPLLAAHMIDIADEYPQWVHRDPVELLREIAVDIDDIKASTEEQALLISRVAVAYTKGKQGLFRQAYAKGDYKKDYDVMQRALEAPKAMGRKVLARLSLEKSFIVYPDVTDKMAMQQGLQVAAERMGGIDKKEDLIKAHERLVELDNEYTELLDQTVKTGNIDAYKQWIHENYKEALWLAKTMSEIWGDEMQWRLENQPVMENGRVMGSF